MKNLNNGFFRMAVLVLLLTGCNSHPGIVKVKPESTAVSGDLSEYLQVVDNEYEVADIEGMQGDLSIKVKAVKPFPKPDKEIDLIDLSASLLGENGMPVAGTGDFSSGYDYSSKLKSLLSTGSGEVVVKLHAMPGDYKVEEHGSKVKKFSLSSSIHYQTETTESTSSGNSEASTSSGSEDWDQILKDYDEYTDQYIKLIKKVKNNDMSAMSEYADMYEKANKLGEELTGGQSSLTPEQMGKMMKIQTKLANAALEMNK